MNIRPSAAIRQNYNEIAELCRKTAEPVFLTKNGEGDLVVMDCIGYTVTMKEKVHQISGKPVLLSRTLAARTVMELLS